MSKRDILKGVYEDNLRTRSGSFEPGAPSRIRVIWKERPVWRSVAVAVVVTLAFVFAALYGPLRNARTNVVTNLASLGQEPIRYRYEGLGGASFPLASLPTDSATASDVPLASIFDLQVRTIVIDPGHGGKDGGAVGHFGSMEKDITLDVARRLRKRLLQKGYQVLMTRDADHKVGLRERVEYANSRRADLFLSIHVNYLPQEPVSLIETYYFSPEADRAALRLAQRENQDSEYSMADFNEMLQKIGLTMRQQESKRMATSIQKSLMRNMRQSDRRIIDAGVKTAPFVVLLGVEAPSILAEIACLNNRVEEIKLNTPLYRERLAASLEEGVVRYLQQRPSPNEPILKANDYAGKTN